MTHARSFRRSLKRGASILGLSLALAAAAGASAFAATVTGAVHDATGVAALGGAQVQIIELNRTEQTASDGTFRFNNVPAGRYTVRTTYGGGAEDTQSIEVAADGTATLAVTLGGGVEEINVVGQRAMLASAISRQRASDTVQSVLTRDAIGQFPDQNVAEATRRLTGVNVLDDQGEGRFITVRGLDPSLNAASINGTRIPSPEADTRSVALDVIPSELIESIEIKKTLTPDMDADTIGASIEIHTTSSLDRKEPFVSGLIEGSYNNLNEQTSPKASVDFSYPVNERFGIAGGLSYYRRKTSTDNSEMDGWSETSSGVVFADTVEYRDYDVVRKRIGGSLTFDFQPSDSTTLAAHAVYSVFDDTEKRGRLTFQLSEDPASGDANTATFLSDDGRIRVRRDLKDRFEGQTIQSYDVGGTTYADAWTLDYKVSYSHAQEHEFRTQDPTRFQQDFRTAGAMAVKFDYTNLYTTTYDVLTGQANFFNPSRYEFTALEDVDGLSTDKEWAFKLDVARDIALDQADLQLKFGGKGRVRNKAYNIRDNVYDDISGTPYTLADVLGGQSYALANIEPIPERGAVRAFNSANLSRFELNALDSAYESNSANYDVDEDIYAGYGMARLDTGRAVLIAGVRVEHTKDSVTGNLVELVEEGGTHGGVVLADDSIFITPNTYTNSYTDWLPSANLRFNATDQVIFRLGVFKSVVRPNIASIVPRFNVEEADDGERSGEFGNPALKPYRAWNFDVSAEWYFGPNAVIQVGAFLKSIDDFIVTGSYKASDSPFGGVFNGVRFDEAEIPINGDKATVKGFEFNYQQALSSLPEPFDGMLVGFNYTHTNSSGNINGRTIPLPTSSKNTFNAMLGYEKGPVSLRLTAAYRDRYLDELGGSAMTDRWVKDHIQFDASAKYTFMEGVQAYLEMVNLNNEPYVAYQQGPGRDRLLQYETYSWTGKFGVRLTY